MQAVILAAGKSTRTYPLTLTKPKQLLKVANKTLLEHNLDNLNEFVSEVVITVGYKKDSIKNYIGYKYKDTQIKYVEQKRQLGTGDALLKVEDYIEDEFISLNGDDIYAKEDFKNILKNKYSILVKKVENPELFGVVVENLNILVDLIEKPEKFISNIANTGLYKLDKKVFPILRSLKKSKRREYELTDAIKQFSLKYKINCVKSKQWIPIGYPWDLLKADRVLRRNNNIIGNNSKISGNVKNSSIGSSCLIKGDVKNSIVMDKTIIDEDSVVEDSIIGENVYFKGRIIAKNNAYSNVKGKRIKVDRFGAVISNNSKLADVIINAGCKIWPNKTISNKTIKKDVM